MDSKDIPFQRIMMSEPFKFQVGPDLKEYFVHKEAFVAISPVLRVLITGKMREAREGVAVWEDIEESDFLGLCEFAYTGKYGMPEFTGTEPSLPYAPEGEALGVYGKNAHLRSLLDMEWEGCQATKTSIDQFVHKSYQPSRYIPSILRCPHPSSSKFHFDHYLRRHVNMYILGDRYDIAQLQHLATANLRHALRVCRETWNSVNGLTKVIRLIYDSTRPGDDLREVISMYVAIKSEYLFLHVDMDLLRKDCLEFASDVLAQVVTLSRLKSTMNKEAQGKRKRSDDEDGS
ncbi:hypothetical protein K449DRAFT_429220 [Hypoxylon sp. EC38]|nr:hypothetical protein K449DRAFT_429220 [Hypoxylon sp. EC38]